MSGVSPAPPAAAAAGAVHVRRVLLMSAGFWCVFCSFSAAQLLQSGVNQEVGFGCLAGIYIPLAIAALFAPKVLTLYISVNAALPASALFYVLMVAANIAPQPAPLLLSCVGVGVAAALLWSAQSLYVQRCAAAYARATGTPLTLANSKMNSSFYLIFSSSGGASAVLAAIFVLSLDAAAVPYLFVCMTALGSLGTAVLLLLVEAGDETTAAVIDWRCPCCRRSCRRGGGVRAGLAAQSSAAAPAAAGDGGADGAARWETIAVVDDERTAGAAATAAPLSPPALAADAVLKRADTAALAPALPQPAVVPSLAFMLRFLVSERKIRWIMPAIFLMGYMQGLFNGAILGSIAARSGLAAVCIVGAVYSFASSAAIAAWAPLLQRPSFGRRWAFVWAFAAHALLALCLVAWSLSSPPPPPPPRAAGGAVRTGVGDPGTLAACILVILAFSAGDCIFWSQVPATVQTFFPAAPRAPCAMASIRLVGSAGNAVATLTSVALGAERLWLQYVLTLAGVLAAACATWHLHWHISSLDGDAPAAAAASPGADAAEAAEAAAPPALATAATTAPATTAAAVAQQTYDGAAALASEQLATS